VPRPYDTFALLPALVALPLIVADLGLYFGLLGGPDITDSIYWLSLRNPILWHVGYIALAVLGYFHFF